MTITHAQRRARRTEIAHAVNNGLPLHEAATQFGVTDATVRASCREHGFSTAAKGAAFSATTWSVLSSLLNTRDTMVDIAKRHGVSRQRVHQLMQKAIGAGIRMPGRRSA